MKNQKGFTLVELAIVLVIIGIILGAILKGQELIKNAKGKRIQNDIRGIEAVVWTFYDRYGRFPGDCDNNGTIDATTSDGTASIDNSPSIGFCTATSADGDQDRPWAELKQAQLVNNVSNLQLTATPLDGRIYIGRANAGTGTKYRNAIAIADIPCFVAKMIDVSIDGQLNAGIGRVRQLVAAAEASSDTANTWTSCTTEDTLVDIVYFFDREP